MQSEAEVVKECIEWLHRRGWICKRNHVGTFYSRTGVPVKVGEKGEADWHIKKPISKGVCMFADVEFKSQTGSQSKEQMEYESKAISKGIVYLLIHSLEDLQMEIQSLEEMVNESKARN